MNNVIQFQRYKDVTDMCLYEIREWCRRKGWIHGFKIDWRQSKDDRIVIERLRK